MLVNEVWWVNVGISLGQEEEEEEEEEEKEEKEAKVPNRMAINSQKNWKRSTVHSKKERQKERQKQLEF